MTRPSEAPSEHAADPRIPVTLLTGFLGAGKTTLLNRVLGHSQAGRIAVIVNEFGEAGIDHDLIEAVEDEVMLLQSGCICCSIRGDLAQTMAELMERRTAGAISFDRVVVETTGMADTGPILKTLLVDPDLARSTRMDGVVTLVDAVNGPAALNLHFEAVAQVAMADLIIISKANLALSDQITGLKARVRYLNATAPVITLDQGRFDPTRLWGLSALRRDASQRDAVGWTTAYPQPEDITRLSGLTPAPKVPEGSAAHDARITSVSIVLDRPLRDEVFDWWLDTLIALKRPDILRIKGIVFLEGLETPCVFHGVQHIFDPPVPLKSWASNDRSSRIVVIGRDLTRPELQTSFDMLRAGQPDRGVPLSEPFTGD